MSQDPWELMAAEFDRMLKEATDEGMTRDEFMLRMTKLSWEWEQLREIEQKLRDENKLKPE